MLETYERKFDGFPARVGPAPISPASEGVDFGHPELDIGGYLPEGGIPICPDNGGDCIPPQGDLGGISLDHGAKMSTHFPADQRNIDGNVYNNVHIESGQNIWRWYYDDIVVRDYQESPGNGGRTSLEYFHLDAYRYFFSGPAIQTETGSRELGVTQTYEYIPGPSTALPEGATHWIVEFDWTLIVSGQEYDRAAESAPGGFVNLSGDQNPPAQHVQLGTVIPHNEHYEKGDIGRIYAERMAEIGQVYTGHAQITVPAAGEGNVSPLSNKPAFHATVRFADFEISTKPNINVSAAVEIGGVSWRPNDEEDPRDGDIASDCLYRWGFENTVPDTGGWGSDWYSSDPWSGATYSRYTSTTDGRAHAQASSPVTLIQSVTTPYPDGKDYIAQFAVYMNAEVESIGISRGSAERQFEWTRSEIAYIRADGNIRQWNAAGMMNIDETKNLIEFRWSNGIRTVYLNGYGMTMPATDGNSGDFTFHVTLASGGHVSVDHFTIMCKNASNPADPACQGTSKTEALAWSDNAQAFIPSLIPSYYISVTINGLTAVQDLDYTVCGNNICGIDSSHEVTAQYVIA